MAQKFRKIPVEIEAMQWDGTASSATPIIDWILAADGTATFSCDSGCDDYLAEDHYVSIHTLEGVMRADIGDWIIRGVAGEFYPCKPEIFEKTYEKVRDGQQG